MRIALVVLVLNEIEGLQLYMPRIDRSWVDQILIVDGGSTDGSVEWCEANGYQVLRQKQRGLRQMATAWWSPFQRSAQSCVRAGTW
jgi:glycosyltransferase involved in cell wall biosynthesis